VARVVDSELKGFIESGVAMVAATRDADNVPAITRAGGCRVSPEDGRVTVFVATEQAARCLDNVRATGSIAVVYVMPHTYECFQVKGVDARMVELDAHGREQVRSYRRAFFANLMKIGMEETLSAGLLPEAPEAFVGVEFTPTEAYCQTPGPGAGSRKEPGP
jgi:hypothetical protein